MLDLNMPIKERQTKILLLLFLMSDVRFDFIEIDSRLQNVFDISLNQKTKGTLSALIRDGLIEKNQGQDDQGQTPVQYRLTREGFKKICLDFPFFRYLVDEWDGMWRIISYEIPEKKRKLRDALRRNMKGWGLGPWHRSFWITPHPIISDLNDLVFGKEEEQYIQAFESTHVFGKRDVLVEKVWGISDLDKKYRELFKTWHEILSKESDNTNKFKEVVVLYVKQLREDPGLPQGLLAQDWIGWEGFTIFKEVRGILMGSS